MLMNFIKKRFKHQFELELFSTIALNMVGVLYC